MGGRIAEKPVGGQDHAGRADHDNRVLRSQLLHEIVEILVERRHLAEEDTTAGFTSWRVPHSGQPF